MTAPLYVFLIFFCDFGVLRHFSPPRSHLGDWISRAVEPCSLATFPVALRGCWVFQPQHFCRLGDGSLWIYGFSWKFGLSKSQVQCHCPDCSANIWEPNERCFTTFHSHSRIHNLKVCPQDPLSLFPLLQGMWCACFDETCWVTPFLLFDPCLPLLYSGFEVLATWIKEKEGKFIGDEIDFELVCGLEP